ncbi:MAG: hypothetical protein AAF267_07135 [Deinococcota bacterium]
MSELLRFDADGDLWHLYKALKPTERPRTYWHYLKMWLVPEACDTCVDVTFIPTFTAMFCVRFELGDAAKLRLYLANRYTAAEREAVGVLEQHGFKLEQDVWQTERYLDEVQRNRLEQILNQQQPQEDVLERFERDGYRILLQAPGLDDVTEYVDTPLVNFAVDRLTMHFAEIWDVMALARAAASK